MSDYIERLRAELIEAEQHKRRRVDAGPVLAFAALIAVLVLGAIVAWPQSRDGGDTGVYSAASARTYRVEGDAGRIAELMRRRLPGARIERDGDTLAITAGFDVTPYTRPGRLGIYDYEASHLQGDPALTNADIVGATASEDAMTSQPAVMVKLRPQGQVRFHALTRTIARRGRGAHLQHLAIVIDGKLVAKPYIDGRQAPDGITADKVQISGDMTRAQAKELAAVLDSGPLPGELN
jgi:SecD-like export protein